MVDHIVATQLFKALCGCDHIRSPEVISHHLDAKIAAGFDNTLDGFRVSALHDHNMGCASLCHHFGLEVCAIHRLKVSNNRRVRELAAQRTHGVYTFGEQQRGPGLQPVDSSAHRNLSRFQCFIKINQVEGNLDNRFHVS